MTVEMSVRRSCAGGASWKSNDAQDYSAFGIREQLESNDQENWQFL